MYVGWDKLGLPEMTFLMTHSYVSLCIALINMDLKLTYIADSDYTKMMTLLFGDPPEDDDDLFSPSPSIMDLPDVSSDSPTTASTSANQNADAPTATRAGATPLKRDDLAREFHCPECAYRTCFQTMNSELIP